MQPLPTQKRPSPLLSLRSLWSWYFTVQSDNPVRQSLNRGLLAVVAGLFCMSSAALGVDLALGNSGLISTVEVIMIGMMVPIAIITRRGGVVGATILSICFILIIAVAYDPKTYAEPPVIHVVFASSVVIAALFINPWMGFLAAVGQAAVLGLALAVNEYPPIIIVNFVWFCLIDLSTIGLPIALGAHILRVSISELAELSARLDARVSERTDELRRIMALREHDISGVVHDINNRMQVVRVEAEELLDPTTATDPALRREAGNRLFSAIQGTENLIDDLRMAVQLDNSALKITPERVDLRELTIQVIDQFTVAAAQAGCQLSQPHVDRLPMVRADRRKIERVIGNLLSNAIKYTRQMPADRRKVEVSLRAEAGGVILLIADSGPGLDTEALSRLGRPFTRLASARGTEGMGLGIYISKGIVELHHGSLNFDSPGINHGTQVRLWLPTFATQ